MVIAKSSILNSRKYNLLTNTDPILFVTVMTKNTIYIMNKLLQLFLQDWRTYSSGVFSHNGNGRVSHGRKLGRTIGFPTANIPLKRNVSPVSGVYVVKVVGADDNAVIGGVVNVGNRPTVNGVRQQLEVHLFDFKNNLYGKQLEVVLLYKIRDEQKFDSFELLKQQIELDAQVARVWLLEHNIFSEMAE